MPPLWFKAAALAARAHRGQRRRDGATPYIAHPARVALTVAVEFGCDDPETVAAALLHDTIEDCDVDWDEIAEAVGPHVADIVAALSKDARLPEPEREPAYDAQLAAGPWEARLVKLADVHDNLLDAIADGRPSKVLDKARRAIALAGDDPRLRDAVERVEAVVRSAGA